MNCVKCQTPLKTKGFRWTQRVTCKECGAKYYEHRTVLNPERHWHNFLGYMTFVMVWMFANDYLRDKVSPAALIVISMLSFTAFFFATRKYHTRYGEKEYTLVENIDYPLAKQDRLMFGIFAILVIGGLYILGTSWNIE